MTAHHSFRVLVALITLASLLTSTALARDHQAPASVLDTWSKARDVVDYVIVGGGTAGLALAGRLDEDKDVTVLVLESGHGGYAQDAQIRQPNTVDYSSLAGSELDWSYNTTKQSGLGDRQVGFAAYRAAGGTSTSDHLTYTRPSQREAEVMGRYGKEAQGSGGWGWKDVHDAMDGSIHFEAPDAGEWSQSAGVANKTLARDGPVFLSMPSKHERIESVWLSAFQQAGIGAASNPFSGQTHGAHLAPATIEKHSKHRSFSRSAYFDPIAAKRSNLQILPDQTVTRVIVDDQNSKGERRVLGIEYAAHKDAPRVLVTAKREVIISAGVVGSPALLQRSGIGAKSLLASVKIDLVKDLPGVGQHLQDAPQASIQHDLQQGVVFPSSRDHHDYVDTAVAMLTLKDVLGASDKAKRFLANAEKESSKSDNTSAAQVQKGHAKTLTSLTRDLLAETSASGFTGDAKPAVRLSLSTVGNKLTLTASLQGAFSRGSVQIKSDDAFQSPDINTAYLSHPADRELLVAALAYVRKIASTDVLAKFVHQETGETNGLKSTSDWYSWLDNGIFSSPIPSYNRGGQHASSSCSMLSEADGGVVDSDLKVHGFTNLRVVDASVLPLSPSSGLLSHVYAIAEIAAKKIKADRKAGHAEPIDECDYEDEEHEPQQQHLQLSENTFAAQHHKVAHNSTPAAQEDCEDEDEGDDGDQYDDGKDESEEDCDDDDDDE
ncbi:unnamed protein product [Parajaminaea phylloscopi]